MSHIVFFSYAREDLDPYLDDFFKDLSSEIAFGTKWAAEDDRVSFQDKKNLRLMVNWKSHIEDALQSSAVLVCITSVKYFNSEFCGKEYYLFDQRRRQGLKPEDDPPPVILPIIWAPVMEGLPDFMNEPQQVPPDVPDKYLVHGLRRLKRLKDPAYDQCVIALADAIRDASRNHTIKPLAHVMDFQEIPNAFASGDWQEAAGPRGWLPGPEVANFVFTAGVKDEIPAPEGRYGAVASAWRAYFPPDLTTILDYAKAIAKKQSLKFREVPADEGLKTELEAAKERKNLTVLVADPKAPTAAFQRVRFIEDLWWEGAALIFACDNSVAKTKDTKLPESLKTAFPVLSQAGILHIRAVDSSDELQSTLDLMLTQLRSAVTKVETDKKDKTDAPPPDVRAAGGTT